MTDHSPKALLNTMMFMNGLYFALRSGNEHRQLRYLPCQIEVIEKPGQRPCLRYTEDISKNHPGGLRGRKYTAKVVIHHANIDNPSKCFVQLFKLYNKLCPADRPHSAFYLAPLNKPKESCRFSRSPVGHNTLKNFVGSMCQEAGIVGYKTNHHSLRATTATRLYAKGVDEQLVMERTGHRSIEGIRSYKPTSYEQQENISDILNIKKPCLDIVPSTQAPVPSQSPLVSTANTNISAPHVSSSSTDHAGAFYMSSCSNITINYHCSK